MAIAIAIAASPSAFAGLPAPATVTATRSGTDIIVNWASVQGATGYHVNYTSDHKKSWHRAHTNATGTSATISNTSPVLPYYVSVSAGGAWRDSSAVHAVQSVPGQVGAITLARAEGELTVSWTAPTGGETPTGYDVVLSHDRKHSWYRVATNVNPTPDQNGAISYKATGNEIKDYRGYHAAVRAVGTHVAGPWRNSGRIHPQAPTEFVANLWAHRGSNFIDVEWDALAGATGYDVEYDKYSKFERKSAGSTTGTSLQITGLTNRPAYMVYVRAYNSHGKGPWERTSSWPAYPPASPSSVTVARREHRRQLDAVRPQRLGRGLQRRL